MKLVAIPVVGIVVASGICCCGDMTPSEFDGTTSGDGTVVEPDAAPPAGGSSSLGSLCGRFNGMNIAAPSGYSVMSCSDQGSSAALILSGSGNPADACVTMKGWATGAGWNLQTDATMGDMVSYIFNKGDEQLVMACTNLMGQATVTMSISKQ